MPPAFMDLMSGLMFASEPEKQPTDQMLKTATRDAFVWRTHLGLKPFEDIGWYAQAGYGLILAGGGGDPSTRVAAATDLPAGPANERFTLKTSATVHVLDLETGWQWRFGQRWVVRAAVGGTFAMAAVAKASPEDLGNYRYDPKSPEFDALDPLRPRVETLPFAGRKLLERKLESTIQTPVVSLGVGYAFF
jgi:hypothetical protein